MSAHDLLMFAVKCSCNRAVKGALASCWREGFRSSAAPSASTSLGANPLCVTVLYPDCDDMLSVDQLGIGSVCPFASDMSKPTQRAFVSFFLPRVSYYTLLSTTQRHPQPRLQQTPSSIINPTPTAAPQSVVVERVNRSLRLSRLDLFSSPPRSSNLSTSALADAPQFNKGRSLHSWLRAWSR
jgi:hypothetical protein